jgi:hypothetical protein
MALPDNSEFLLDGQQRCISMRQGLIEWNEESSFRLWIDITTDPNARRREHKVEYHLFLCTRGFPWGTGISDGQRRGCRQELKDHHCDQIGETDHQKPDYRLSLGYTWPAKAALPVPFATIAGWYIKGLDLNEGLTKDKWPDISALSDDKIRDNIDSLIREESNCTVASCIREKWTEKRDQIFTWVRSHQGDILRALKRRIYFELAFDGIEREPDYEYFGEAFNRINRLGVRLDGIDLFFSSLKLKWPQIHNFVWSIYQDEKAGKLLSPPQLAHAAVRLAIARSNTGNSKPEKEIADRVGLDISDVRHLLDNGSMQSEIEKLLMPSNSEPRQASSPGANHQANCSSPTNLQILFQRLRDIMEYKGRQNSNSENAGGIADEQERKGDDIGFPLPLLARIGERKPHILHNILMWLDRCGNAGSGLEIPDDPSRKKILRYALVDYLFLYDNDRYRKESFKEIGGSPDDFPDCKLIELAAGQNELRVDAFKCKEPGGLLITPEDLRADFEANNTQDPVNLHDLLLWAQRNYLNQQFPDYDPTLFFNVAALPWDKDHIWPQAKMYLNNYDIANEADKYKFYRYKDCYLNSFGNFCLLDKRRNRAQHDDFPKDKYKKKHAEEMFAFTEDDYLCFSGLGLDLDLETNRKFPITLLDDLRDAVNTRRVSLYRSLYESLSFGELRGELAGDS